VTTAVPRLRFAPSPTGFLHIGSARTALHNWLVARQTGGTFILRIEDTDDQRDREKWVEGIGSALRWLGLDWDEGPYRQSERAHLYAKAADDLVAAGRGYWCDCTREAVDARARERGGPPGYDGYCRERGLPPGEGRALRFRTPDEGVTVVSDLIRGAPAFEHSTIEDFVLVRSNGRAMFVLANVVDDIDMAVTHVIRGEEHLPTTPKYLLLWDALDGGPRPVFAHVPVIVNERRQKLSKRRDPVAVELYRAEGYLPEVMLNYLALLGWGPADGREHLSVAELVAAFRLEDVHSAPAFFDVAKLRAFNGDAIRALSVEEFAARAEPWLVGPSAPWLPDAYDPAAFARMALLVQERVAVLGEVPAMVDFLFLEEPLRDEASWKRAMTNVPAAAVLDGAAAVFEECRWDAAALKEAMDLVATRLELAARKVHAAVRVAVTGRSVGPPLFESLEVLGRDRTVARVRAARARLG
jgi:glutamyl-tRNA synthetase